jgi:hypothetical protein
MKTTRLMAVAALIAATGPALHVGQAQQVGARRIDLQRHDLTKGASGSWVRYLRSQSY